MRDKRDINARLYVSLREKTLIIMNSTLISHLFSDIIQYDFDEFAPLALKLTIITNLTNL